MISSSMRSLVGRGVTTAHAIASEVKDPKTGDDEARIPPLAALIFFLTLMTFVLVLFCVTYTYGHLIPTLCMVESPETDAYVPVDTLSGADAPPAYSEDEDGMPKPNDADEILLVRNKAITSSLRKTIAHLRTRGGIRSQFRGIVVAFVGGIVINILMSIFTTILPRNLLTMLVAGLVTDVIIAQLQVTWIHIVISEPSPKYWYQRIPSYRNFPKILPAILLLSLTSRIVIYLPWLVVSSFGPIKHLSKNPDFQPGRGDMYMTAGQLFFLAVLSVMLFVLIEIPATVTMVRVAASMLPEEDETIVPFDRTYGGKVTPAIVGGAGKIGLVEAWRSFPWQSRKRLLMLCAKVTIIFMGLWLAFSAIVVTEAHLLFGAKAFGELMKTMHQVGSRQ